MLVIFIFLLVNLLTCCSKVGQLSWGWTFGLLKGILLSRLGRRFLKRLWFLAKESELSLLMRSWASKQFSLGSKSLGIAVLWLFVFVFPFCNRELLLCFPSNLFIKGFVAAPLILLVLVMPECWQVDLPFCSELGQGKL